MSAIYADGTRGNYSSLSAEIKPSSQGIYWNIQPTVNGFPMVYPILEAVGCEQIVELVEEFNPQPDKGFSHLGGGYVPKNSLHN